MMKFYTELSVPDPIIYNVKKRLYDDNIFTFDIETISLFKINKKWQPFDYTKPSDFYSDIKKAAVPYIWQFGINETVYYGREFSDFATVLEKISDPVITKFIYIHNASYEMQFLIDILQDNEWTIVNMCARNIHQPIQFTIKELNITIRCSYMLTNLKLEQAAKKYTNVQKAVGDLDYNVMHSPKSKLTEQELHYCEMDIVTLYEIIKHFRDEYNHIYSIPLTQTGEVRKAIRKEVDYWYFKRMWSLVPSEKMYCYLIKAFQGGITHANALYANQILHNVWSYDINSSYLYALTAFKYPSEPFFQIKPEQMEKLKESHAFLLHIKLTNVRSKLYNHFLSRSKVANFVKGEKGAVDNGRIVCCSSCDLICTETDLELIKSSYYADIKILSVYASFKKYLDKRIIMFILKAYKDKTQLKNKAKIDELINAFYMKQKQSCNCVFGISCQNPIKSGVEYDNDTNTWITHQLGDIVTDKDGNKIRYIDKKLNEMKSSYSTLMAYSTGVWCTSYSRMALWTMVQKLDSIVAYYDTDSVKGTGDIGTAIDDYNNKVIERLKQAAADNDIDISYYMPLDDKGNPRPVGIYECETTGSGYKSFVTMGAKKYCYEDSDGLHLTVSGVSKSAVSQLKSIEDFKKGFVFDYDHAKKLTHYYLNEQEPFTYTDKDGNRYRCKQQHSIVLQPTTYTLGITDEYENFIMLMLGYIPERY